LEERDRLVDALLRDDMRKLNSHLPRNRRTLKELLSDPAPRVLAASGDLIKMKKHELEEMSRSLPTEADTRVKLPIVLFRRGDLGSGAFTVMGDRYEEYAMLLLAGSFQGNFEQFREQKTDAAVLFKPQISLLMRRFHSLLILGFGQFKHARIVDVKSNILLPILSQLTSTTSTILARCTDSLSWFENIS